MLLVEMLIGRYAPLDSEAAAEAVSELIHFRKLPSENHAMKKN